MRASQMMILLAAVATLCRAAPPALGADAESQNSILLDDFKDLSGWEIGGAKEVKAFKDPDQGQCLLWHSIARDATTMTRDVTALKEQLAGCDAICFEYLMDGEPSLAYLTVENLPGYNTARNWYFKFSSRRVKEWRTARFEFRLDDDSPGNGKDPRTRLQLCFSGWKTGPHPVYEWRIRNLRAVRYPVTLDYDETAKDYSTSNGVYSCRYELKILNRGREDRECALVFDRKQLKQFTLACSEEPFTVKAGEQKVAAATLSIPADAMAKLEPLYTEEAPVLLRVKGLAETDTTVLRGWQELPLFGTVPPRFAGGDRPRVRCSAARLAELRDWCAKEPDFMASRDLLVKNVENCLKTNICIPDTSGWYDQGWACPKCGTLLYPAITEQALAKIWCPTCKDWIYANRNLREKVVTEFHRGNATMTYECALAYALTGDKRYAERARDILLGYARTAPKMKAVNVQATGYLNLLAWALLGEAYVSDGFAWGYDLLMTGPILTEGEQREIEQNFLLPMMKRMSLHNGNYSNQTAEFRALQMSIALACGNWAMAGRALNGDFGFREMVQFGFDDDGWTIEGSQGYQQGAVEAMDEIADAAHNAYADIYHDEKYRRILKLAGFHHLLFAEYKEPYPTESARARPATWGGHSGERWFFCSPRAKADLVVVESIDNAKSRIQEAAGYTFVRFGEPKEFNGADVNWGQTWERSQADLFSCRIFLRGKRGDGDSGRISYSNPYTDFTFTSLARSTIVVDKSNSGINRQFSCLIDGGKRFSAGLVAEDPARPLYAGVRIARRFVAMPEGVLIADEVESDAAHDLDWPFYPPAKVQTSLGELKPVEWNPKDGPGYRVPSDLTGAVTNGAFSFEWPVGAYKVRRTVAGGEPKEVVIGTARGTWDGVLIPFSVVRKRQLKRSVNVEFFEAFDEEPALKSLAYAEKDGALKVSLDFASGTNKVFAFRPPRMADGKLVPPEKGAYVEEKE